MKTAAARPSRRVGISKTWSRLGWQLTTLQDAWIWRGSAEADGKEMPSRNQAAKGPDDGKKAVSLAPGRVQRGRAERAGL